MGFLKTCNKQIQIRLRSLSQPQATHKERQDSTGSRQRWAVKQQHKHYLMQTMAAIQQLDFSGLGRRGHLRS